MMEKIIENIYRYNSIFILTVLLLVVSCDNDGAGAYNVNSKELLATLDLIDPKIRKNKNLLGYFILPGDGCKQCIEKMEGVIFQKPNLKKSFGFIFTRTGSIKLLHQKEIGRKLIGLPNVFIDSLNLLDQSGYSYIYPSIVYLKDGQYDRLMLLQDPSAVTSFK